ncbi:(Fe-S)-binding protein [Pararhodospirillum photometricum]|uniref:Cysteine-rich domain-containing protein n=1 Tax=Pararhodospirillum photometricum DSM 122 TaxID=1150469 RepID=H6SML1_PARPM|nr:(Fe-S)-binding protein [Pararhodospirillum photometricum]CCG09146.1 Putative uncharacterized protein [Pararhodospirillum photometricum DSM 122]
MSTAANAPVVGVFVTCVADLMRPTVGLATAALLEKAGCRVVVPAGQTCCGQMAFNAGARDEAAALARQVIALFAEVDYVVVPSGSCAAMIRQYPELLPGDPTAQALAARTHELLSFLCDVLNWDGLDAAFDAVVTYHDSCSGLRTLGISAQPRRLLGQVKGLTLRELATPEECCGFGGSFCLKFPELSARLTSEKLDAAEATGAETLLGGDLGCLLSLAGRARREGRTLRVRHVVEVLAGMAEGPALGEETPS